MNIGFWPKGVDRHETLTAFMAAYSSIGYAPCLDGELEPGFEKIVIYVGASGPTHAARQLFSGKWTSKLGQCEDIEHDTVVAVEGPVYGTAAQYMKRAISC